MPDRMDLISALRMYEELKQVKNKFEGFKFTVDKDFFFNFVDILLEDRDRLLAKIEELEKFKCLKTLKNSISDREEG